MPPIAGLHFLLQACIICENSIFDLNLRHPTSLYLNLDLWDQKRLCLPLSYTTLTLFLPKLSLEPLCEVIPEVIFSIKLDFLLQCFNSTSSHKRYSD